MAISYPLSLPSVAGIKNVNFRAVNTVCISASPFTYGQQVYKYEGQKWEAEVTLPSMQRENAAEWISFLVKLKGKYIDTLIDGYFLNDKIHIKFENKEIDNAKSTDVVFKMSKMNLLAKTNFLQSSTSNDVVNGNILLKKGKNKITAIFDYKDNKLNIIKSNLRNTFLDGKMQGEIKILP